MADISQWENTAAGNNKPSPPDFWQEGQSASSVNDTGREMQAAIRRYAEDGGWFDWGHVFSYISGTAFSVPGDQTAVYTAGRRVRVIQTATTFGTIVSSSFSTVTTVTIAPDSGSLANEAGAVSVGPETITASSNYIVGELKELAHATIPAGWLICDGAAVSRTTYGALFSAIGTIWGNGDGSTTFNLPPPARTTIGSGQGNTAEGGGTGSTFTLGQTVGAETHTLTVPEMPAHTHGGVYRYTVVTGADGVSAFPPTQESTVNSASTGGDGDHNNMQPSMVVTRIIFAGTS